MTKALIIGGGIAGPVTALALHRAGIEPVIYESYDTGADNLGYYLRVEVNGLDALRILDGTHHRIRASAFPTTHDVIVSADGDKIYEKPIGGELSDGTVTQTIKRAELYRVLRAEAEKKGIGLFHGKHLVSAENKPDGRVRAYFSDGSEDEGDLLIGCDGLHSQTRRIIDPAAPKGRYVPLLNIAGYSRDVPVDVEAGKFHMLQGRRAFFCYIGAPNNETWWFANVPWPAEPTRDEFAGTTSEQWLDVLHDLFSEDTDTIRKILDRHTGEIAAYSSWDLPSVPVWHSGSMVIIGDAAHATSPSSGQGASIAIEDAVVLAKCLRDLPDVQSAFIQYEKLRRDRVERVVAMGAAVGEIKTQDRTDDQNGGSGSEVDETTEAPVLDLSWVHDYCIDWDTPMTTDSTADA